MIPFLQLGFDRGALRAADALAVTAAEAADDRVEVGVAHLANPDRAAAKAAMLENTLSVLADHAPGIRDQITNADILMPWEIEEKFGLAGGNWHHGELAVEQMLFLRPLAGAARYETPLPRLWLAGSGSHPGGWVTGTAGWNAAERILKGGA